MKFFYKNGRLHFHQISVEMPSDTIIGKDTCSDRFSFIAQDKTWRIEIEVGSVKDSGDIWDSWLDDCNVYKGPAHIICAGLSGEQAVWCGAHDLYYEVRFPVVKEKGHVYLLMVTLHIPNYSIKDVRTIMEHPIMQRVLHSLRLEDI